MSVQQSETPTISGQELKNFIESFHPLHQHRENLSEMLISWLRENSNLASEAKQQEIYDTFHALKEALKMMEAGT